MIVKSPGTFHSVADPTSTCKFVIISLHKSCYWNRLEEVRTDAASGMSFDKGQLTQGQIASVDITLCELF
jgi:hypothetical protein